MFVFIPIVSFLLIVTCFFPQGLFGAMVAYRSRGPMHTDETGFPVQS